MNNIQALNLLREVELLINNSKKSILQVVDKEDSTKIVEIREIEPLLTLPAKVAYILLKHKNILLTVKKSQDDLIEELRKTFLKEQEFDEEKYKEDKEYAKEVEAKLNTFFTENEVLTSFLKDEATIKLYPLRISIDKTEDKDVISLQTLDPSEKFNLSYVTDLIYEYILKFE